MPLDPAIMQQIMSNPQFIQQLAPFLGGGGGGGFGGGGIPQRLGGGMQSINGGGMQVQPDGTAGHGQPVFGGGGKETNNGEGPTFGQNPGFTGQWGGRHNDAPFFNGSMLPPQQPMGARGIPLSTREQQNPYAQMGPGASMGFNRSGYGQAPPSFPGGIPQYYGRGTQQAPPFNPLPPGPPGAPGPITSTPMTKPTGPGPRPMGPDSSALDNVGPVGPGPRPMAPQSPGPRPTSPGNIKNPNAPSTGSRGNTSPPFNPSGNNTNWQEQQKKRKMSESRGTDRTAIASRYRR